MPHILTEVASFDPTVTVPDGTDVRVDAAEVVAAIAQALANRTRSLKAVTDNAAVKNVPNTFTAAQAFTAGLTASAATVSGALNAGSATVSGALTANGGITAADGKVELTGNMDVSGRLRVNGGLGATDGTLEIENTLVVNADAYFNVAHVYLDDDVDLVYPSPSGPSDQPQRLVQVDISRACVAEGDLQYNPVQGFWANTFGSGIGRLEIPIIIPRVTLQWSFQVIWAADALAEANSLKAYRWDRDYSIVGVQTPSGGVELGSLTQSQFDATAGKAFAESGPVITETHDPAISRYGVVVTFGDGTNNRLYGLRLQFWDPGPRNG